MAKREDKGGMGNFARGAELWMHQARLFMVAIWTVLLISLVFGLVISGAYFWNVSTSVEKYSLERNWNAQVRNVLGMTAGKMEIHANGASHKIEVKDVIPLTQRHADEAQRKLRNAGLIGLLSSIGILFLVSLYWFGYGKGKMTDKLLRGARLVDGKALKTLIENRNDHSPYSIAGVPMRKNQNHSIHYLLVPKGLVNHSSFSR